MSMKNWPEVQKASAVVRIPEISPSHQSGLIGALEERADHPPDADDQEQEAERVGQAGEGVRRVGEAETAETRKSPPKSAQAQRLGTSSVASARFSTPSARNSSPTRTPTVVTDAWSN